MDHQSLQTEIAKYFPEPATIDKNHQALIPPQKEGDIVFTPTARRNIRRILRPYCLNKNLLMVGDAGIGKNALIYYINSIRQHPVIRYSFNGDTLAEELIGSYRLEPGETNRFIWVDGPLTRALRHGYTFVADEMNLAAGEVLKRFGSVFEHGYLDLVEGDGSRVSAADGFSFVATQNPTEGFEGRKPLPREIQKHFHTVFLNPYSATEIGDILSQLFSALPRPLLDKTVRVNEEVEYLLDMRRIGQKDLERFHFNIRNMKILAGRLEKYCARDDYSAASVAAQLEYLYLLPFRQKEDRQEIKSVFLRYLNPELFSPGGPNQEPGALAQAGPETISDRYDQKYNAYFPRTEEDQATEGDEIKLEIGADFLQIEEVRLPLAAGQAEKTRDLAASEPLLQKDLRLMKLIMAAIENRENLLLEGTPEIEAERVVEWTARLLGREITTVYFSKGMHTSDILGGLKPVVGGGDQNAAGIVWLDGPLTRAIRQGHFILFKGLEAANAEIVEKLNMLTDDTRAITLPPEAEETKPLELTADSRIFALKYFRKSKSKPTISRAFRNRFCAVTLPAGYGEPDLKTLAQFSLEFNLATVINDLPERMARFHLGLRERASDRKIGGGRVEPYQFGILNFRRWLEELNLETRLHRDLLNFDEEIATLEPEAAPLRTVLEDAARQTGDGDQPAKTRAQIRNYQMVLLSLWRSAGHAYLNEISGAEDLEHLADFFTRLFQDFSVSPDWELIDYKDGRGRDQKKKSLDKLKRRYMDWDPKKHYRDPNTGKAAKKVRGRQELEKGVNIDTPETGGETKEGADAWYGKDTFGNKGSGPVGGGGGAWGYRTEELYQNFLKKFKPKFEYHMGATLAEFNQTFGPEINRISINFDRLMEPEVNINRFNKQSGFKVDARRYMSFLAGKGDDKIFDHTDIHIEDDRLKGVEIVFAINKGRRLFNFNFSLATLVSMMSAANILAGHKIPFTVFGYSDKTNQKISIDLDLFLSSIEKDENFEGEGEQRLFDGLVGDWFGDTVDESEVLEGALEYFSPEVQTPIVVMLSDFRGKRAKLKEKDEINSHDTRQLHATVNQLQKRGFVVLGIGVGNRAHSELIFDEHLEISTENYQNMPAMVASKLTEVILKFKTATV